MTSGFSNVYKQLFPQRGSSTSQKVNWSGLEEIPLLSFQLAALTEISLDISSSHLLEREWHQLRVHTERLFHAGKYWTQSPPRSIWYLLKEDTVFFFPLSFSFPYQTGLKRPRWCDESNLPAKLDVLKRQTQEKLIPFVYSILAACPVSLF